MGERIAEDRDSSEGHAVPGLVEQCRAWHACERACDERVLDSLESVPPEGRAGPVFQRGVDVLAHVIAARRVWLHRLGAMADPPPSLFPTGVDLREVRARLEPVDRAWDAYLESALDAAELERRFRYAASDGHRYESRVLDVLTHLFGHGAYHRGQIAMLVRQAGGEPAATDYILRTRVALDA